jgi:hypothetical protein
VGSGYTKSEVETQYTLTEKKEFEEPNINKNRLDKLHKSKEKR